ncbi:metallophosphoesterase [Candidatus Fermentibacterales bacterium]|nr:metallophosphoesterase [Candidatus Fermentibacterales bacterium]
MRSAHLSVSLVLVILAGSSAAYPLRVAVLGDRTGSPDDGDFARAVSTIALMRPDLVLSVGDFIDGYCDSSTAAAQWEHVLSMMGPILSNHHLVWVPGNHDIWDGDSRELWEEITGVEASHVEEHGEVVFVVWDSSTLPDYVDGPAMRWLRDALAGLARERTVLLITHKPFSMMVDQDSAAAGSFHELMLEHDVEAVICGHIHAFAADRRDGVLYMAAGPSGAGNSVTGPDQATFDQVAWLTILPDSVSVAVLEAYHAHGEGLNTPAEQCMAFRYSSRMIDLEPLECGSGVAGMILTPQEPGVTRLFNLRFLDTGEWLFESDTLMVELEPDLPVRLEVGYSLPSTSSPYPPPSCEASLIYGPRDKHLSFGFQWPVEMSIEATRSDRVRLDGRPSEGEYSSVGHRFADAEGEPASYSGVAMFAASDDSMLYLCVQAAAAQLPESGEVGERITFCLEAGGCFAYIRVSRPGEVSSRFTDGRENLGDPGEGWVVEVDPGEAGGFWSVELGAPLEGLGRDDGSVVRAHVFAASQEGELASWSYPLWWDSSTMGRIVLP